MRVIAHRANLDGPSPLENTHIAIQKALDAGFDVEIDVTYSKYRLWLGHDKPQEMISLPQLMNPRLWVHAKTPEVFAYLHKRGAGRINYFYQDTDAITLTGMGYLWCHVDSPIYSWKSVIMHPAKGFHEACYAICTDYPRDFD